MRIGELAGESVEVREGLSVGEQVVTDGAAWLVEGARVAVVATSELRAVDMRIWAFTVRHWQFTLLVLRFRGGDRRFLVAQHPALRGPGLSDPLVTVIAVYPGADPADVERLIVDPIEDAMNELDDVEDIESESRDGLGVVNVEFSWGMDPEEKYDEVVREVNALRAELPEGLASLDIRKASPGLVNIVQVALVSEKESYRELESRAEDLREGLETVPGVREAETWAYPEPEVAVAVDLERLARLAMPLDAVDRGDPGRQRRHSGRCRRRRPAQVQPEDLGQLRVARGDRRDRDRAE